MEKAASPRHLARPRKGFDERFLCHLFGAPTVPAEPVRHVDERTLPAADDLFERGEISLQHALDRPGVVFRAHEWPDIDSETTARPDRLRFLSGEKTQPDRGARSLTDQSTWKGLAQQPAPGRMAVGLFLFLSVAAASLFTFIGMTVWASERRREREAYYESEVLKKIADTPGSAPAAQEYMRERQRLRDRNVRGGLRLAGLIVSFAGIGVMGFLSALRDGPPYQVGLIPLLVGLAMLIYGQFLAPKG